MDGNLRWLCYLSSTGMCMFEFLMNQQLHHSELNVTFFNYDCLLFPSLFHRLWDWRSMLLSEVLCCWLVCVY
jgi:hypothetical protein